MTNKYVKFNSKEESDVASYKNRLESLTTYDDFIYKNILFKNGSVPTDDLRKFLNLKIKDATDEKSISVKNKLVANSYEALDIEPLVASTEKLKVLSYIQLFLDSYMSPLNSDIEYRLGRVTATKIFQCDYNNRTIIYDDDKDHLDTLAQYDKYGRIDTTSNFRNATHIEGSISRAIPSYDEYYVNWFFPPFDKKSFTKKGEVTNDFFADYDIKKREWDGEKWVYLNNSSELVTFDKDLILSLRDKPTYRAVAFKPLNDNISFLQYIFEQCSGIVSTYLTEWDLSIYIQEGLLSKKYNSRNSLISLNNRIFYDNPSGVSDESALSFGVLNAAISKTPLEGGIVSNTSSYLPYAYPLSVYWWPYESINRGDGLDKFYNTALKGFDNSYFKNTNLRNKIKWYDELGAAYSGWYNWDNIRNYQALYTTKDDGLGSIDIVHMNECIEDLRFESDAATGSKGEIEQIIESLYSEDEELGFPEEEWDETRDWKDGKDYYRLSKHFKTDSKTGNAVFMYAIKSCITDKSKDSIYYKSEEDLNANIGTSTKNIDNDVDIGIEGDIRILGIRIPGSGLLRTFLKRSSINDRVLALSEKAKNGYSSSSSASRKVNSKKVGNTSDNKDNSGTTVTNNNFTEELANMLGTNESEPARYAKQDGVSQWSPMLYGGPHGKFYSPKTIQGYFELDNPFLRNVPRLYTSKKSDGTFLKDSDFYINDKDSFFKESESFYNLYNESNLKYNDTSNPSRSPSKCMNLLNRGFFDYTMYPVYSLKKFYVVIPVEQDVYGSNGYYSYTYNRPSYYNGHKLYYDSEYAYYSSYVESSTNYLTPDSLVCRDYNRCPHYYSTGWTEWNNYYSYAKSNEYYFKDYNGRRYSFLFYSNEYLLKKAIYIRHFSAYYYDWTWIDYKRPLMHSDPNEYWSISRTNKYTITTTRVDNFWRSTWLNFCAFWTGARYVEQSYLVYSMNPPEEVFRLIFPNSPCKIYKNVIQKGKGEKDDGANYPYIVSQAESDFMENVLNNTTSKKHKVLFFASNNNEAYRDKYGPDMIFSANCYIDTYNYKGRSQHWYKYRHKCHADWDWYWDENVSTGKFIRVDLSKIDSSDLILSGLKPDVGLPESNLSIAKSLSSTDNYSSRDIPSNNSKAVLYSSPISFESTIPMSDHVSFAGYPINRGKEQGIHGWGYSTTLPGFQPRFNFEEGNSFEDPNEYLNIRHRYRFWDLFAGGLRNFSFNSLVSEFFFPFYHLSSDAPTIYPSELKDESIVFSFGVRGYKQWDNSPKIRGLMVALRNCFTTSTFFKLDDVNYKNNFIPCIVTNDSMLRTAVRTALHQKSYLKKAQEILRDNIDFDSIKSIIENKIDKEILDKSIYPETKDTQSVFYHYWLDKAYTIFTDKKKKDDLLDKFTERMEILNIFIKKSDSLVNKEIGMWSYNDFVRSLENLNMLQETFLDSLNTEKFEDSIESFMYMYLNVLYDYRKYFINKRCNKVDGTLWQLRSLESAIPLVAEVTGDPKGGNDDSGNTTDNDKLGNANKYKVDFYKTTNSVRDKINAACKDESLNDERTKILYIKVEYVSKTMVDKYLKGIKQGTWDESISGKLVYIKENQRWAKLPFDDEYRYVSREYSKALEDFNYNEKIKKVAEKNKKTPKLKNINKLIDGISNDKCVFNIKWTTTGGLDTFNQKIQEGFKYFHFNESHIVEFTKTRNSLSKELNLDNFLNLSNRFPHTYERKANASPYLVNEFSIPSILFDVNSGIDLNKVEELSKTGNKLFDNAQNTLCNIKDTCDYWSISIPENARPLTIGYKKGLYIKEEQVTKKTTNNDDLFPNSVTSATGSFGYALYPITEEQANTLPGVGINMENISLKLKDKITNG